ncbi:MAG: MTH1187 family thiamine-binding protein [Halofilum sp. (in: g-proteobacteria)]|nr:MTH1187 family thiamine-binding protein [Halofilum sp. (in: g-proteobacteria)]
MHVVVELCLVPMGVGVSVSEYVAACERVLREAGFEPELHAYGTNFEGEWDDCMAALRQCHEVVHDMGVPRIFTAVKLGTRTDRVQTLTEKVTSVRAYRNGPRLV